MARTQRSLNNYGNDSRNSQYAGSQTERLLTTQGDITHGSKDFDFNKVDPSPIMTRIIEKIKNQMSDEALSKKRNIVDREPEIGKLKLKEGSIMEYIPSYNNMFN